MTKFGCPESQSQGWSTGGILLKSGYGYIALAEHFSGETLISEFDRNVWYLQDDPYNLYWKLKFCVKLKRNQDLDTGTWIPGNYNIYMSGNVCPEGFTKFSRTRFFSKHTVYGNVPNFTLGKNYGIDYMNLTMCERVLTSRENETLPQIFSMLETVFMLEKANTTDNGMDFDDIFEQTTNSEERANRMSDESEINYAELTSDFNISKGSFPPTVMWITVDNNTYLMNKGSFLSKEHRRLVWYQFDLMRSLTVSKIEILFDYYKNKTSTKDIIDNIPFIICYYDDVKWSFLDLEATVCNTETKYTSSTFYLFMRGVYGRFVTLVFDKLNGFQMTKLEKAARIFTMDTESLGGDSCNEDLGMIDGSIRDFQISASSWRPKHLPSNARPFSSGWCAGVSDERPWILVDLIAITTVEGVRFYNSVWPFTMYYGTEVDNLQMYNKTAFRPGSKMFTFMLPTPLKARYIKLEVQKRLAVDKTCLRFELRGCKFSGIPSLNCHNASEMFGLTSGIATRQETVSYNISSKEDCNSNCLLSDNCSVTTYRNEGDCVQYRPSPLENWLDDSGSSGSWSAKLCATAPAELFPSFRDQSGTVLTNVEVIKKDALITTVGYPFSFESGQRYKWIVKYAETYYIKMIFTNVSLSFETPDTHSSCDKLFISKDIRADTAGKVIDNNFNNRKFVVETGESLLFLTFVSCLSEKVIISTGFRAIITKGEIPASLSIDSVMPWSEGRNEICNRAEMMLTSMSVLNFPFRNEERWNIQAGEHHNLQIEVLYFYILCANDPGELRSTFTIVDFPDKKMFCNTNMPPRKFYSKTSDVTIIFQKHEDTKVAMIRREGFRLRYKKINHSFGDITDLAESTSILRACSKVFDKCYSVYSSLVSWKQAESLCWSEDQRLVSTQSTNELQYVHYLLREQQYKEKQHDVKNRKSYNTSIIAHIGIFHVRDSTGSGRKRFIWSNTAPVTFSAWIPGHPTTDACTRTTFQYYNTNKTWESEDCFKDFARYFVCETQLDSGKGFKKQVV
ncbi:uncharacterized protein LOC123538057 [Mercenaria mercenaria]|uniref:uncharacterized protein LOC123538057 n=1 Tax=Mercenaria mercenaria TaxID=6596 RepID=UPI00234FA0F2|nr:uncharacterized protein LOC123538057 [Mercenaria mercenaria]